MLLYWQNTNSNDEWEDTGNWWEDADATTNHGSLPGYGDSCDYATGSSGNVNVGSSTATTVNLGIGAGVCNLALTLFDGSTLGTGTFTNSIYVSGGTVVGSVCATAYFTIGGGTVVDGVFSFSGHLQLAGGTINGGCWTAGGVGGTSTTISGGTWVQNGTVIINGASITGSGGSNPGFPVGVSSGDVPVGNIVAAADVRYGTPRYTGGDDGTCYVPTAAQTLYGVNVDATTGTVTLPNTDGSTPDASLVKSTAHFGAGNVTQGTLDLTNLTVGNIASGVTIAGVGPGTFTHTSDYQAKTDSVLISAISAASVASGSTITATSGSTHVDGTFTHTTDYVAKTDIVAAADVRHGTQRYPGGGNGTCYVPIPADVAHGVQVDNTVGTLSYVDTSDVRYGVDRGDGELGSCRVPAAADVRHGVLVDATIGQCHVPAPDQVLVGIEVDVNQVGSMGMAQLAGLVPVNPTTGLLTIVLGDDYSANTAQPLLFEDPGNWPDLSGANTVMTLYIENAANTQLSLTGHLVTNSSPQQIMFCPTHADTNAMTPSAAPRDNDYSVVAVLPSGEIRTLLDELPATVRKPKVH